jgi:transketolase
MDIKVLEKKAAELRETYFDMFTLAQQGHPGSVMSQVEILTTLFYGGIIKYEKGNPAAKNKDNIIISKGHATMGLYPIFVDLEYFGQEELLKFGTPKGLLKIFGNISIPGIDATSGSLGHGPGIGIGYSMAAKADNLDQNTFVLISEGEMYEGSIWESALFASQHRLDNLVLILDRNHKIILGDTEDLVALEPIDKKWESFGFEAISVDGHSFPDLLKAFRRVGKTNGKPLIIIAETVKGKGIELMENEPDWHYWQGLDEETTEQIRSALQKKRESYE